MEKNPDLRYSNELALNANVNIVIHLANCTPENKNYRFFCDKYETYSKLIFYLAKKGINHWGL